MKQTSRAKGDGAPGGVADSRHARRGQLSNLGGPPLSSSEAGATETRRPLSDASCVREGTDELSRRRALLRKLKDIFRRFQSQPVDRVVQLINPILRGWVNYFAVGHSSRCFGYVREWVEKKIRRHLMRARKRPGFGWKRWSRRWLYDELGLGNRRGYSTPSPLGNVG